ncbi:hypothetical protein FPZ42_08070 [Mucilaginibacter achroorhodeus]|uniref:CHAT domain-containing protein n=1 Tax=Mucilaginibacter achroorhodeus TaxID=2599294 RepID=A0A563U6K1_9SPHI|nr:hypothetical protein [Mucilaginibacter achroorhodeus]TWR26981.1 hypothetical protein FPZ42_08070 [Mucilaginibacter achroorhodeus]
MSKITLTQVIEIEVRASDLLNPFNDLFDRTNVTAIIDNAIKDKYKGEVEYDQNGGKLVSALLELNKIYGDQVSEISEILKQTGLNTSDLIERIIASANYYYLTVIKEQHSQQQKDSDGRIEDINSLAKGKFKNMNGASVAATDVSDSVNDAANEIISLLLKLDLSVREQTPIIEAKVTKQLQRALQVASILNAMKTNFDEFKFETASIELDLDTITFKKTPGNYFAIKAANRMRQRSLITEFFVTATKFPRKPINKPFYKLDKGTIEYNSGTSKDQTGLDMLIQSDFLTFHFHLHLIKIDYSDHLLVSDLFKLFEHVRVYFFSFDVDAIIDSATASQNYQDIPFKINIVHLVSFLTQESGLPAEFVQRFVDGLSQPLSQSMDVWAKPFIKIGDDFLFLVATVGGHLAYQFDRIIDGFISKANQLKHFKNLLELELNTLEEKHKYTFNQIDFKEISDQLNTDGLLIYQSLKHLVVMELCLIKFPLEAEATAEQMVHFFERGNVLRSNIGIVQQNIKQLTGLDQIKITGILVTNHPVFSGMVLDQFPVLDAILLQNYLDTGKYTRAIFVAGAGKVDSEALSSYPYYHDDETFDANFLSFAYQPAPVYELQKNMHMENFKISPGDATPIVFSQHPEMQSLRDSMNNLVFELEDCLKQLYYFNTDYEKDPEGKRLITQRIDFLTPLTFSYFSVDKTNRNSRMTLLSNFKKVGIDGMVQLVNNLLNLSRKVAKKGFKEDKPAGLPPIDHERATKQWDEVNEKLTAGGPVSPSTFQFTHDLSDEDRDNLIRHLFSLAAAFGPGIYTEEQINDLYILVTIISGLAAGLEHFEKEVYTLFLNLMDLLNYNGHYQKARDFSEEALAYSFNYERVPLLGWLVQFKCFAKQKSVHDAAFYGGAYFAALNALSVVKEHQVFDGFYNAMLFFRNFGFNDMADNFFQSLNSMPLKSYQRQQITLSYLNSKLEDIDGLQGYMQLAEDFLTNNILQITEHGQQGALPWTALIYNLVNIESRGHITIPASLKVFLAEFEKVIDPTTLKNMQGQFFPNEETSVDLLKDSLNKALETRSTEDYAAEITALQLLANNVASLSVDPLHIDNLLLCGLVINDQTLNFHQKVISETLEFITKADGKSFSENYGTELIKSIPIKSGQVITWIFEFDNKVYALYIDENKGSAIEKLSNWDIKAMRDWLNKLPDYYFDEKNGYPINQQEGDYIDDLKELEFSRLNCPFPYEELLVYYSFDLAAYPPNLLEIPVDQTKPENIEQHEVRVQDHIKEQPYDFIGFHKPVTNIISLEYFSAHSSLLTKKVSELSVACWVPIVDEDMVLFIAENTLRPVIEGKYNTAIQTTIYPKPALNALINVFVAHGAKTVTGFRSVHTRGQNAGHALINESGVARVFGTGFIAVIFICDSGAMTKDIFNQKLISLVHEILSFGYQAVVAPAWRFNPAITGIWLDSFLESLKSGNRLAFAVQQANQISAKKGFDEYFGFYSPRGWAAMHLYGNPNIVFDDDGH